MHRSESINDMVITSENMCCYHFEKMRKMEFGFGKYMREIGLNMLKAIKEKTKQINKNLKVLGVTVLTSLNNKSLKEIGHTKTVDQLVLKQAGIVKKSGCDGIVCSAKEAKMIRKKYKNLLVITPGIRLPGDNTNDQARVMTPKDAFKNKVSGVVIGRSLTKGNIKNNIKKLINHLY